MERRYQGSATKALIDLYPEVQFNTSRFKTVPKKFWTTEKKKIFFDEYAAANHFDPLVVDNWYGVSARSVEAVKKGKSVLSYHRGLFDALQHCYPFLEWDVKRFESTPVGYWKNKENRRNLFESYAKLNNFEVTDLAAWQKYRQRFTESPKAQSVLAYYKGRNFLLAISDLFPELDITNKMPKKNIYAFVENQRKVFDNYALSKGADPLNPKFWYSTTRHEVNLYGASTFMHRYRTYFDALSASYPDIGLDKKQFTGFWLHRLRFREQE